MTTKRILLGTGLILAALTLVGYRKVKSLETVFSQMKIWPAGIKNLQIGVLGLKFDLTIAIQNPTPEDFSLSTGGLVTFKRVIVYRNNKLFGSAIINMQAIEIPAYHTIEVKNVPFNIDTATLVENIPQLTSIDITTLKITGVVEIFGNEYTISN